MMWSQSQPAAMPSAADSEKSIRNARTGPQHFSHLAWLDALESGARRSSLGRRLLTCPRLSCLPRAVTLSGVARAVCTRGKAEEACLLYGAVSPRGLPNPPSVRAAGSAQGPVSDE